MDRDQIRRLERADTEGWADNLLAAPADVAAHFGFTVRRIGGATLLRASRAAAFPGLNRVVGLGLDAPFDETLLDEVIDAYREVGATHVILQLGPLAMGTEIDDLLHRRGITAKTRHVKLWRRPDASARAETDLRVS